MIILDNMTFERLLLDEIGLEFSNGILIDQDTRLPILNSGKYIRSINNIDKDIKLMSILFNYFIYKISEEQKVYIDVVYYKQVKNSRSLPLAIKVNGKEIISKIYVIESLKYLDLICQLNGEVDVNLSRFDAPHDT